MLSQPGYILTRRLRPLVSAFPRHQFRRVPVTRNKSSLRPECRARRHVQLQGTLGIRTGRGRRSSGRLGPFLPDPSACRLKTGNACPADEEGEEGGAQGLCGTQGNRRHLDKGANTRFVVPKSMTRNPLREDVLRPRGGGEPRPSSLNSSPTALPPTGCVQTS